MARFGRLRILYQGYVEQPLPGRAPEDLGRSGTGRRSESEGALSIRSEIDYLHEVALQEGQARASERYGGHFVHLCDLACRFTELATTQQAVPSEKHKIVRGRWSLGGYDAGRRSGASLCWSGRAGGPGTGLLGDKAGGRFRAEGCWRERRQRDADGTGTVVS